ncbi:siderophore-interacting protein [Microbacterium esteraromaticum]|uniref:siderophore-interacting protein n=1 Tax=Microbacterium esteraromaticum TaxID=57043 RepID=UPI00195EAD61|nr:siderophore-interacting protein [Microbacterium esteraromaticum]MBM7466580.1 NADPH-dependent ferric siderophore reductase [Microbacterium esteraromaticum]
MSDVKSGFSIERQGLDLRFRAATLESREWLAPNYVRVRLAGAELAGFASLGADDHMRLFFAAGPTSSVDELRASPSREYTPLAWGENWLDVEFAVHGDEGVGAPWAASAPLGSFVGVGGPRGSAVLTGEPGSWLLVGDETAIPAIRRFAAMIPSGTPARIVIEVASESDQVAVDAPVAVEWLHRGDAPAGSALIAFIEELGEADAVSEDPFVFIAAEQSIVRPGRALLTRWGVDVANAVVKGYWKRGTAEYHAPH